MEKLSPLSQLDAILNIFIESPAIQFNSIAEKLKKDKISIGKTELEECLNKLQDDKYIKLCADTESNLGDMYRITFEGRLFIEEERGYIERNKILNQRKIWEDAIVEAGPKNADSLNRLTKLLVLVGGLVVLWDFLKYAHEHSWFYRFFHWMHLYK